MKNKIILFILILSFISFLTAAAENIETIQDTISLPNVEIIKPTPEPTPRPVIGIKVHWKEPIPQTIIEGTSLQLISEVKNCETAKSVTYQWQVDKQDGNGFIDIKGATSSVYTIYVTEEIKNYTWRLKVTVEW